MRWFTLFVSVMLWATPAVSFADSLYSSANFKPLVSDHKARGVGDILTVFITESAVSRTSANTTTNKGGNFSAQFGNKGGIKNQGTVGINQSFKGGGGIQREGKLLAQMTVIVKSIYPNGDLHVAGTQHIEFNNEKQAIKVEGRVRPVDISSVNTLLSTRIADAKISYIGKGVLAKKQKQGWIWKILPWLFLL